MSTAHDGSDTDPLEVIERNMVADELAVATSSGNPLEIAEAERIRGILAKAGLYADFDGVMRVKSDNLSPPPVRSILEKSGISMERLIPHQYSALMDAPSPSNIWRWVKEIPQKIKNMMGTDHPGDLNVKQFMIATTPELGADYAASIESFQRMSIADRLRALERSKDPADIARAQYVRETLKLAHFRINTNGDIEEPNGIPNRQIENVLNSAGIAPLDLVPRGTRQVTPVVGDTARNLPPHR
jgi:hypothetical protein